VTLEELGKASPLFRAAICVLTAVYFFQFSAIKSIEWASFKIELKDGEIAYPQWLVIIAIFAAWILTAIDLIAKYNARRSVYLNAETDTSRASLAIKNQWPPTTPNEEKGIDVLSTRNVLAIITFLIFFILPLLVGLAAIIHFLLKLAGVLI